MGVWIIRLLHHSEGDGFVVGMLEGRAASVDGSGKFTGHIRRAVSHINKRQLSRDCKMSAENCVNVAAMCYRRSVR